MNYESFIIKMMDGRLKLTFQVQNCKTFCEHPRSRRGDMTWTLEGGIRVHRLGTRENGKHRFNF